MLEWFETATLLDRTFALCAVVGGIVFVIRMALQAIGGHDADALANVGDATFEFLSFHALNAFVLMFGLVGLSLRIENQASEGWAILGASAAGCASMLIVGFLSLNLRRLQSSGNLDFRNAVGQVGEVYLTIPAGGSGQVQVTFQNKLQVVDAIATCPGALGPGQRVKVVDVSGASTLIVEPIASEGPSS